VASHCAQSFLKELETNSEPESKSVRDGVGEGIKPDSLQTYSERARSSQSSLELRPGDEVSLT
jgi:hypothetical protein